MSPTTDSSFSTEDDSQSLASGIESSIGGVSIEDLASLSISDEKSDVTTDTSSGYSSDANKDNKSSSPSNEPYRPPFVIKGSQADADDVFHSSPRRSGSNQRTPTGPKAVRGSRMSGNWRSASSTEGSDVDPSSPSRAKVQRDAAKRNGIPTPESAPHHAHQYSSPQNHNTYEVISDNDAQGRFPPSCCVFVANLLQSETEEALQAAVTKAFSEYGVVFVKIRRDSKQMPFAFCQYTNLHNAERAIREGRGRLINGRPCRTEKAKAHRIFFVERKYGPIITPEEVREMMSPYGTITSCYTVSSVERTALNLNEGVIVEFEMYDEGQTASSAFKNHDIIKCTPVQGMASPPRSSTEDRVYLERYSADRSSIFIGALPSDVTEDQLRQIFEPFGPINEVLIRVTPSRYDPEENVCFAFIEFRSWESVTKVLSVKHNFAMNGKPIRVSQKGVLAAPRRSRVQDDSPARRRPDPPASPMTASPMAPQSPPQYGFYGSSPMSYTSAPTTLYTDGQGQYYYASPYTSPSYYSPYYPAASPAQQTYWSQPQGQPYFGAGYPASPYGSAYTPANQQQPISPPPSGYQPSYPGIAQVERSSTPTPVGHPESALESQ